VLALPAYDAILRVLEPSGITPSGNDHLPAPDAALLVRRHRSRRSS
jgi:hypothetical protein